MRSLLGITVRHQGRRVEVPFRQLLQNPQQARDEQGAEAENQSQRD
jgi:hypothetical protein